MRNESDPVSVSNPPELIQGDFPTRLVAWILLSSTFVIFVTLGSVGARIWREGRLSINARPIRSIWVTQVDLLPSVGAAWITGSVFVLAIVILFAGIPVALWLLLHSDGKVASTGGGRR